MSSVGPTGHAQFGTGAGSFWVTFQEGSQRLHHRPEVAASVQPAGICDSQSGIPIMSRWRQAFRVDAVGDAHHRHIGIPRRECVTQLTSVGDDPLGGPEGKAFEARGDDAKQSTSQHAIRLPDLLERSRPRIAQVDPPGHGAADRGECRHEMGGVRWATAHDNVRPESPHQRACAQRGAEHPAPALVRKRQECRGLPTQLAQQTWRCRRIRDP